MRGLHKAIYCLITLILPCSAALAAEKQPELSADLTAAKIIIVDGREQMVSATESRPGDLLQYTVRYTNNGSRVLHGVVATLPIPATGLSFVADTATPIAVEASLDGHSYAPVPLTRLVHLPDGREQIQPVPVGEYRFLRWHVGELAPGGTSSVHARLRVSP